MWGHEPRWVWVQRAYSGGRLRFLWVHCALEARRARGRNSGADQSTSRDGASYGRPTVLVISPRLHNLGQSFRSDTMVMCAGSYPGWPFPFHPCLWPRGPPPSPHVVLRTDHYDGPLLGDRARCPDPAQLFRSEALLCFFFVFQSRYFLSSPGAT